MSNFQTKFRRWQEKMNNKTDKERHNFAITVSLFIGAAALFFVVSSWYFILSGKSVKYGLFTEIEESFRGQKENLQNLKTSLNLFETFNLK